MLISRQSNQMYVFTPKASLTTLEVASRPEAKRDEAAKARLAKGHPLEVNGVICRDLTHLPDLVTGDGGRADEAAETRSVEHESDWHIA